MIELLDVLKNADSIGGHDIDRLVVLAVVGEQVRKEYGNYAIPAPEWLIVGLHHTRLAIKRKRREYLYRLKLEREYGKTDIVKVLLAQRAYEEAAHDALARGDYNSAQGNAEAAEEMRRQVNELREKLGLAGTIDSKSPLDLNAPDGADEFSR